MVAWAVWEQTQAGDLRDTESQAQVSAPHGARSYPPPQFSANSQSSRCCMIQVQVPAPRGAPPHTILIA